MLIRLIWQKEILRHLCGLLEIRPDIAHRCSMGEMNTLICPKHSSKNLWAQLEPKKLQLSRKIDFFGESSKLLSLDAYKAHMAK